MMISIIEKRNMAFKAAMVAAIFTIVYGFVILISIARDVYWTDTIYITVIWLFFILYVFFYYLQKLEWYMRRVKELEKDLNNTKWLLQRYEEDIIPETKCERYLFNEKNGEHVCTLYGIGCDDPVASKCPYREKKREQEQLMEKLQAEPSKILRGD